MARPNKTGLDYFPLDVDFFADEKIAAISGEFGIKGDIVVIKLLCAVYRNGYFILWNEPMKYKMLRDLPGISPELLDQIINRLVKWGFFDESLFNSVKVLTSQGIQKRFFSITKRRNTGAKLPYVLVSAYNNGVSACNNPVASELLHTITPQSKVKESKDITPYVVISSSSSPSGARTREEGESPEKTGTGGITACAQEAQPRKSPDVAPEKSCAKKVPPQPLPDGTYEYIPVTAVADYLTGEDGWIESLCMNKHLDRDYVEHKIREYAADVQNSGEVVKDKRDCKRHFNNWLRKSQQYEQNQRIVSHGRSTKNQPPSPDELARAVAEGISRAHTRQEWE